MYNLDEHEARIDVLEGTLRGHIGYIEEALGRLEGKATEAEPEKKILRTIMVRESGTERNDCDNKGKARSGSEP